MINSYDAVRETYLSRDEIQTLRVAAFVVAINKIAKTYLQLGVFP
jgi:glutamate dehydrogenase (NAD(P)+)